MKIILKLVYKFTNLIKIQIHYKFNFFVKQIIFLDIYYK